MENLLSVKVMRLAHGQNLDLPMYMTAGSVGLDLRAATEDLVGIDTGACELIPTGLSVAIPQGYEAQVRTRSGLAAKSGVVVLNSPGTIDQDYRGEIKVILKNLGQAPFAVEPGMRVAQLVFAPVTKISWEEVPELDNPKERGSGGFGSTGTT
jgi:dUTP pyrophosphatase